MFTLPCGCWVETLVRLATKCFDRKYDTEVSGCCFFLPPQSYRDEIQLNFSDEVKQFNATDCITEQTLNPALVGEAVNYVLHWCYIHTELCASLPEPHQI